MRSIIKVSLLLIVILTLTACSAQGKYPFVSLKNNVIQKGTDETEKNGAVRVAIASVISPRETRYEYDDFIEYLESKLGVPVALIQRQTYAEVNQLLKEGKVDIALICSLEYVTGSSEGYLEGIASPEVSGKALYRSYLVVRENSSIQTLEDLRGKRFAFTDPDSFSGRLFVLDLLKRKGYSAENFFGKTYYTYSHDYSVKAVADGVVDGSSVDSLVFDKMKATGKTETKNLRVIETGDWVGTPPVVVSTQISKELKQSIQMILLSMDKDKNGIDVLKKMNVDRFVSFEPDRYRPVQEMSKFVGGKQ